jgi:hypothetical protein
MQIGRMLNDPRSTGLGLSILTWIALLSDSPTEALEYSEQSLAVAVTPQDRHTARNGKGCILVLLGQVEAGQKLLEEVRLRCVAVGRLYDIAGSDPIIGLCKILQGNIRAGIQFLEEAILRREKEGYRFIADWYRLLLCEVYLQIIGGKEKLSVTNLLKNLPILITVKATATSRIRALTTHVLNNPQFEAAGYFVGRAQMALGLLYKVKKKQALALDHLTEARRIISEFGQTPILARIETALGELKQ